MTAETSNARGEVVAERHALYGIRWVKQLRDMRPGTQWFIEGREWPIATVTSSAGVLWHMAESEIPHGTKYYTAPPPAAARGDVRGLVDALVDAAYQDGMQELDAMSDETLSARSALEQALAAEGVQAEPKAEARGGVACPTCGAPAVRSEREGVLEIEDVYRHLPDRDESERLDWLADQMRIVDLQLILGSTPLDAADLRAAIDVKRAALTEARNVR